MFGAFAVHKFQAEIVLVLAHHKVLHRLKAGFREGGRGCGHFAFCTCSVKSKNPPNVSNCLSNCLASTGSELRHASSIFAQCVCTGQNMVVVGAGGVGKTETIKLLRWETGEVCEIHML